MAIMRWNPSSGHSSSRNLAGIQDEVDRLFDSFFGRSFARADAPAAFYPAVDVEEVGDEFILRADLPGVNQKDVRVSLMGDVLSIRGERKPENANNEATILREERLYGTFERTFTLGIPVRNDKVRALYRDGVLEVHIPKAEEATLKEIEVQVAS